MMTLKRVMIFWVFDIISKQFTLFPKVNIQVPLRRLLWLMERELENLLFVLVIL